MGVKKLSLIASIHKYAMLLGVAKNPRMQISGDENLAREVGEIHGPDQVLVVFATIQQDVLTSPRRHLDYTVESPNNDVVAIREHKKQLNGQIIVLGMGYRA